MTPSPQIQVRISAIAKELANGKTGFELVEKYGKRWNVKKTSINNYIKLAKPIAKTLQSKADNAASEVMVAEIKEATLKGLKTKHERLMILQNEVDRCFSELYDDAVDNFADFGGGRKNVKKQLTVIEKVKLRQVIYQLQSEISKIEGDYAPVKNESKLTGELNFSDLMQASTDELFKYLENRKK